MNSPRTVPDLRTLSRIGDSLAPSTIAQSVWAGHRFAREFQEEPADGTGYLRERVSLRDERPDRTETGPPAC